MDQLNSYVDMKIVFAIFIITVLISIFLSIFIIILISLSKIIYLPANLLVCHTCLATILYIIMTTINICFFYTETILTDWWCRIIAYLNYTFLNMVSYSYAIQGISRLLFIVFYTHRRLFNYNCHLFFIIIQIFISFLISLPTLITKDIRFRPLHICLIPAVNILHTSYFFTFTYFIPLLIVIIIYGIIYHRVIQSSVTVRHARHLTKRDIDLIRNILILLIIFLIAGIPSLILILLTTQNNSVSNAFYMFTVAATSMAVMIEKICLIFLNKDIWKEMKKFSNKLHPSQTIFLRNTHLFLSTRLDNRF